MEFIKDQYSVLLVLKSLWYFKHCHDEVVRDDLSVLNIQHGGDGNGGSSGGDGGGGGGSKITKLNCLVKCCYFVSDHHIDMEEILMYLSTVNRYHSFGKQKVQCYFL